MSNYCVSDLELLSNPAGFCGVKYGIDWLYDWQFESLSALELKGSSVSLVTVNGAGKTSVLIVLSVLWHLNMFPGSPVVYISASNRQIKGQLMPALRDMQRRWHPDWNFKEGNEYSLETSDGAKFTAYATDDPGLVEGWHPPLHARGEHLEPELFIIIDEMKSLKDETIDPFRLRNKWTRQLNVSTPRLLPMGAHFDNHHKDKESFRDIGGREFKTSTEAGFNLWDVKMGDCPHIREDVREWTKVQRNIRLKGRDHPVIQSSYFAEWPSSGKYMVFNMDSVGKCMSAINRQWGKDVRVFVDLSGGRDEIVLVVRVGNMAKVEWTSHESDAVFLSEQLCREFGRLRHLHGLQVGDVWFDQGHNGKAIGQLCARGGWPVNFFDFGSKPKNDVLYLNARSEMYHELSDMINMGEVIIEYDEELKEQLSWITVSEDGVDRTKLKLISKKDLPKSPDRADAIAGVFYNMPRYAEVEELEDNLKKRLSPTWIPGDYRALEYDTSDGSLVEEGLFY